MRQLALLLISAYQRWISPHKGYACAHRVHLGGPGCSALGARLIRRFGLLRGLPLLQQRLRHCGQVFREHPAESRRPLAAQRGDCDLPCDLPCDGADADASGRCGRVGRALACGCDACDLFDFGKKRDGGRSRQPSGR